MSSALQSARRYRAVFLATTVLAFNATLAHAQNVASTDLPPVEVSPPTDQNKTRARPTYDESGGAPRPARTAAPSRGTGTGSSDAASTGTGTGAGSGGTGTGVRQFNGIVGTASTVITAEDIAHSPSNNLPDILAQVPGVQLTSLFGSAVNGVKTSVDLRGLRRLCPFQYADPGQRPPAQRRRHVAGRSVDHSAQFDRAHRDHPRQQRRGALWRQRDRRRHQHRHQERRRRSAGGDPRRGRRRLVQHAAGQPLRLDQLRAVVDLVLRQRHQVRRLSRQQRARPDQRRRQHQLHDARPQGLPDGDRRRPEARPRGRTHCRSLDRSRPARHRPQGHQHAVRLRQPAGQERHRRVHQDDH